MKLGKLPEPMLSRSVLRAVGHRREEILAGPAVGRDCAVMEPREGEVYVFSSDPITGTTKDMGKHSVYITANDLAAAGAEPVGIMLTILLPPKTEERELKEIMRGVESTCRELNMEIMGGHTEITDVVKQPLLSLTGVGRMKKEQMMEPGGIKPGQDIVITKWIGLEGTSIRPRKRKNCFWNGLRRCLWIRPKGLTSIFRCCRRQRLPARGAFLPCMTLQRAVCSALCGKWPQAQMLDWIST